MKKPSVLSEAVSVIGAEYAVSVFVSLETAVQMLLSI